jgi:hypothetical protein
MFFLNRVVSTDLGTGCDVAADRRGARPFRLSLQRIERLDLIVAHVDQNPHRILNSLISIS